jgi:hypothetical protein
MRARNGACGHTRSITTHNVSVAITSQGRLKAAPTVRLKPDTTVMA